MAGGWLNSMAHSHHLHGTQISVRCKTFKRGFVICLSLHSVMFHGSTCLTRRCQKERLASRKHHPKSSHTCEENVAGTPRHLCTKTTVIWVSCATSRIAIADKARSSDGSDAGAKVLPASQAMDSASNQRWRLVKAYQGKTMHTTHHNPKV